jgi:UDP-N-acetyl-D-mannosaminuronic acid dehydrogenase
MPPKGHSGRSGFDVCVVGLGYVGLPTACALAEAGLRTIGVDTREDIVDLVNAGKSPLQEEGLIASVRRQHGKGRLTATRDVGEAIGAASAVIIAVQTPLEGGRSNLSYLKLACEQVASSLRPESTVILESTVPPGTCSGTVLPIFREHGLNDGVEFFFAFCPERIAPGDSLREFKQNDRIIGADAPSSLKKATRILKFAVRGKISPTDLRTAETTKLVENAARDVYIAFANDLAKISARIGVDSREVIGLANTHPRVKILSPGPGVGGPCLTKDPYLLLEGLHEGDNAGTMIRTARMVNDSMGEEVLGLVRGSGIPQGAKVAVLGTAYKPEVDDPRSSPSEPIIRALIRDGYDVNTYDPYCKESFGARPSPTVEEAVKDSACVLLLVGHRKLRSLGIRRLARLIGAGTIVIDAAGIFGGTTPAEGTSVLRLGDGRHNGRKG